MLPEGLPLPRLTCSPAVVSRGSTDVAHSGPTASGRLLQTLVLTDIATGWTECAPLLVREQSVLIGVLGEVRKRLPFERLGFDTDSVFLNEAVRDDGQGLALSSPAAGRIARTTRRGLSRRTVPWSAASSGIGASR